ncbi:hypothetical protein KW795_03130 [Candidatus Microgenomates bacterium]|nr:hypothetical protein [Candidatus Microgenomates bacterium]
MSEIPIGFKIQTDNSSIYQQVLNNTTLLGDYTQKEGFNALFTKDLAIYQERNNTTFYINPTGLRWEFVACQTGLIKSIELQIDTEYWPKEGPSQSIWYTAELSEHLKPSEYSDLLQQKLLEEMPRDLNIGIVQIENETFIILNPTNQDPNKRPEIEIELSLNFESEDEFPIINPTSVLKTDEEIQREAENSELHTRFGMSVEDVFKFIKDANQQRLSFDLGRIEVFSRYSGIDKTKFEQSLDLATRVMECTVNAVHEIYEYQIPNLDFTISANQ